MKWDLERSLQAYEDYLVPGKRLEGPFEGWQIQGLLGRGGMALVYLIEQRGETSRFTGNLSVLKIIPGYLVSDFLVNEYESLKRLQSPNIVRLRTGGESHLPIHGNNVCKEIGYLELEYCPGGTLEEFRRSYEGPMPPFSATKCMLSIFNGLNAAHQTGIRHGDICTRNVLLDGGEMMKISDFGLARLEGQHTQGRHGRLRYFPPEAFGWRPAKPDYSWDIWACGMIFLTLISGSHPLESYEDGKCEKLLKSFESVTTSSCLQLPPVYQEALKRQVRLETDTLEGRIGSIIQQALSRTNRPNAAHLLRLARKAIRDRSEEGQDTLYGEYYDAYFQQQNGKILGAKEPPRLSPEELRPKNNPSEDITYIPSNSP